MSYILPKSTCNQELLLDPNHPYPDAWYRPLDSRFELYVRYPDIWASGTFLLSLTPKLWEAHAVIMKEMSRVCDQIKFISDSLYSKLLDMLRVMCTTHFIKKELACYTY